MLLSTCRGCLPKIDDENCCGWCWHWLWAHCWLFLGLQWWSLFALCCCAIWGYSSQWCQWRRCQRWSRTVSMQLAKMSSSMATFSRNSDGVKLVVVIHDVDVGLILLKRPWCCRSSPCCSACCDVSGPPSYARCVDQRVIRLRSAAVFNVVVVLCSPRLTVSGPHRAYDDVRHLENTHPLDADDVAWGGCTPKDASGPVNFCQPQEGLVIHVVVVICFCEWCTISCRCTCRRWLLFFLSMLMVSMTLLNPYLVVEFVVELLNPYPDVKFVVKLLNFLCRICCRQCCATHCLLSLSI